MDEVTWRRRMRWSARRGMLEIDEMFAVFLANADFSTSRKREQFEQLLTQSDHQLFRWFFKSENPDDLPLAQYVADVRSFVRQHIAKENGQ